MFEGVIDIDRGLSLSLSEQIYRQVRLAVRDGQLSTGYRLPSSRSFAQQLGVSRNVITQAYELLKSEAIIEVKTGSAPVIANHIELVGADVRKLTLKDRCWTVSERGKSICTNSREGLRSATSGVLTSGEPALDIFPSEAWARCLRRTSRSPARSDVLYQNVAGLPSLTHVLADYLSDVRGVVAAPRDILITSSTQASLTMLSLCLAKAGDPVLLENPGYLGARDSFLAAGLDIRPIEIDEKGAVLGGERVRPKLIYLTPSHQFPLGYTMALSRRLAIIDFARTHQSLILEDDYDSEFLFSNRPVASMQGLAPDSVVYLGTFAKTMLPGLRLAYMVVPPNLTQALTQAIRNLGVMASAPIQSAMAVFIKSGQYRTHLRHARLTYTQRGDALTALLKYAFGDEIEIVSTGGGVQLAVIFTRSLDDVALARHVQSQGVNVSALSTTYLRNPSFGLIIGFSEAHEKDIEKGVSVLRKAYDLYCQ